MAATLSDIRRWIDQRGEATHMIVMCDTFDWDDYPVYVDPDENVRVKASENSDRGDRIMEVYSFTGKHTIEAQLSEYRAHHYD